MQLLSLCFCLCVLCVQYLHGWVLAPLLSLPSQDRDSRPHLSSCAHGDKHRFLFQLAFCLKARWKCISTDIWSKQTKQPESYNSLQASSLMEGEGQVWRARSGAQDDLKVKGGWGLVRWRLSQTQQPVLCSHRPYNLSPWRKMSRGNFPP